MIKTAFHSICNFLKDIFKNEKPVLPEDYHTDIYIWHDNKGKKHEDEIRGLDLSQEKIDFSYNNGVAFLQDINDGMKIIHTRTTLLLGYLSTLVAALTIFLFNYSYEEIEGLDILIIAFSAIVLMGYLAIIFFIAIKLISPSFGAPIYNEPANLMNKEMFKYNLKMMKVFETERIQNRILFNLERQDKFSKSLKGCILATFILPILAFIVLALIAVIISAIFFALAIL